MGDQSQADLGEAVDDLSAGLLSVVGAPADISATVVELCNINKSFGSLHVIRDVSLSVQKGECVCIVGPSGSGKTTLIRCINALEAIQGGTIVVNGHSLGFQQRNGKTRKATESELARQRQEIGMVFQRFNLFPHLTALENITCGPIRVRGTPQKEAEAVAHKLLGRVGLGHKANAYPSQL
ncbi:amino acid ABC transporter ATP-binding protein, partial [Mesorhizobium sp. M7D.F.Ca.US.004.03.1.1]|uniref:amino acid ABC transporter ATP-binding protein n=1 Tax=Mesorhizobium sp. M7D.F.Ca.US.004.03.1.1 TaxID=2496702 RepID=UPI000FD227A6